MKSDAQQSCLVGRDSVLRAESVVERLGAGGGVGGKGYISSSRYPTDDGASRCPRGCRGAVHARSGGGTDPRGAAQRRGTLQGERVR